MINDRSSIWYETTPILIWIYIFTFIFFFHAVLQEGEWTLDLTGGDNPEELSVSVTSKPSSDDQGSDTHVVCDAFLGSRVYTDPAAYNFRFRGTGKCPPLNTTARPDGVHLSFAISSELPGGALSKPASIRDRKAATLPLPGKTKTPETPLANE